MTINYTHIYEALLLHSFDNILLFFDKEANYAPLLGIVGCCQWFLVLQFENFFNGCGNRRLGYFALCQPLQVRGSAFLPFEVLSICLNRPDGVSLFDVRKLVVKDKVWPLDQVYF